MFVYYFILPIIYTPFTPSLISLNLKCFLYFYHPDSILIRLLSYQVFWRVSGCHEKYLHVHVSVFVALLPINLIDFRR